MNNNEKVRPEVQMIMDKVIHEGQSLWRRLAGYDKGEYCKCGEQFDTDCFGNIRCLMCDSPCPGCYDGGMDRREEEV